MAVTVAQLGARVLHKCGLTPVSISAQPPTGTLVSVTTIAVEALRKLGVNPIAAASQPPVGIAVSQTAIAGQALRLLGVNPYDVASGSPISGTTTLALVATETLRRMAVISGTETPSTEDAALALEAANETNQMVAQLVQGTWSSSAIPEYAMAAYITMTMALLRPAFGMQPVQGEFAAGQAAIQMLGLSGPRGQTIAETAVADFHQVLNSLGVVPWTLATIPQGASAWYAQAAA